MTRHRPIGTGFFKKMIHKNIGYDFLFKLKTAGFSREGVGAIILSRQ